MKKNKNKVNFHFEIATPLFYLVANDLGFKESVLLGNKINAGIYYVTLIDGNKKFTKKIFIQ